MKQYQFREIDFCEMCGTPRSKHKILGQRLNQSQGFQPKNKIGISVSVLQCLNCYLIYSNPQPVPVDIQDHYGTPPEEYWKSEYFKWEPNYFSAQIEKAKSMLNYPESVKALDIGAGIGKAMLSMDYSGFDTFGIEPSVPFYEKAISEMKIDPTKLKLGTVEELEFEKDYFDFITFGAVFEHLYEPAKSLEKALGWLRPQGIIHIEVPSSKWLMSKLMNIYFRLKGSNYVTNLSPMHAPFHLHEFDILSFEKLEDSLNFRVESYSYDVCSIFYMPQILHSPLKWYMKRTNRGMQLTVYLRKCI